MNSCRGKSNKGPSIGYQVAQGHLNGFASSQWDAHIKASGDEAKFKHQIELKHAINRVDAAELADIAHSCAVCDPDASPETTRNASPLTVAKAFVDDAKNKLLRMEEIMARIDMRSEQIEKLEQHLNTYNHIARSLNVVLPANGTSYSYAIDPDHGVTLVIETPEVKTPEIQTPEINSPQQQPETGSQSPDLIDLSTISPTSSPAPTPPTPVPSPPSSSIEPATHKSPKDIVTAPDRYQPESPVLGIWDTSEELRDAMAKHKRENRMIATTPPIFRYGIQYSPPNPSEETHASRMVIFSDLAPGTRSAAILSRVRGGPVLRVAAASPTTAFVWFVNADDAHTYITYLSELEKPLTIDGATPRVVLAPTPSYPVCAGVLGDVKYRGFSRCLAFRPYNAALGRALGKFLEKTGWEKFVDEVFLENTATGVVYDEDGSYLNQDGRRVRADGMLAAIEPWLEPQWVVVEEDEPVPKKPLPPAPVTTLVLHVYFRDIVHARNVFFDFRAKYPRCGVIFVPDPCDGPLWELDY